MLFSSLRSDHLKRTVTKGQSRRTHTDKKNTKCTSNEPPMATLSPEKERKSYSRVLKRCLLSVSTGVKFLVFYAAFLLVFGFVALLFFSFSFFHLTYSRWTSTLPSCLWSQRIFPSLPGSRLTIFLSRCKFSTLTTRQPMVMLHENDVCRSSDGSRVHAFRRG